MSASTGRMAWRALYHTIPSGLHLKQEVAGLGFAGNNTPDLRTETSSCYEEMALLAP